MTKLDQQIRQAAELLRDNGYAVREPGTFYLPCVVNVHEVSDADSMVTFRADALLNGRPYHVLRRLSLDLLNDIDFTGDEVTNVMGAAVSTFIANVVEAQMSSQIRDLMADVVSPGGRALDRKTVARRLRAKIGG